MRLWISYLRCLSAGLLAFVTTALAVGPVAAGDPAVEAVMSVDEVHFTVDRVNTKGLVVTAHGTVSSGGWFDAKLRPRHYESEPNDRVLDVDFVATRPEMIATQVLSPVTAQLTIPVDSWVRGVRIHARDNSMERHFGG